MVRIRDERGGSFQERYASERQARYFAAVYRLQRECLRMEQRARRQLGLARGARAAPRTRA